MSGYQGATFTTASGRLSYTPEEYVTLANAARRAGHMGVAMLLLNISDSAFVATNLDANGRYNVDVHPETKRIVNAIGG